MHQENDVSERVWDDAVRSEFPWEHGKLPIKCVIVCVQYVINVQYGSCSIPMMLSGELLPYWKADKERSLLTCQTCSPKNERSYTLINFTHWRCVCIFQNITAFCGVFFILFFFGREDFNNYFLVFCMEKNLSEIVINAGEMAGEMRSGQVFLLLLLLN